MNRFCLFWGMICLQMLLAATSQAAFSGIYIFGDAVSATTSTNAPTPAQYFYGKRYTNGRTWVEVLAQRQGLGLNAINTNVANFPSNNFSFFGHDSAKLVGNVASFVAPPDATNDLFVVWVCNADFVGDLNTLKLSPPSGTNLADWTTAINLHLTNHFKAITNLYAKGCRTLIAPNAADISKVPVFNNQPAGYGSFVRQQINRFNTNYAAMLYQIATNSPDLKIYSPNIFKLLDDVLTNAASYGLTNALYNQQTGYGPQPIDAVDSPWISSLTLNGPGTNYIFWEDTGNPTAKFHAIIADVAQQMLSPVSIGSLTPVGTSNQLQLVNGPVGMTGSLLFATNLPQSVWQTNSFFIVSNVTQTTYAAPTNSMRFYRVKFPWQWSWP